jgi:hypothetical protein
LLFFDFDMRATLCDRSELPSIAYQ